MALPGVELSPGKNGKMPHSVDQSTTEGKGPTVRDCIDAGEPAEIKEKLEQIAEGDGPDAETARAILEFREKGQEEPGAFWKRGQKSNHRYRKGLVEE